jgi:hypothetical protein
MGSPGAETDYKVFVGGISWNMTDEGLMDEFKEHGATKAEIMMDKMTNRSRGFGFVWFASRAGMQEAINAKHNTELEGRKISVKEAIPQDQIPPEARGRDRYRASSSYRGGGYERGYGGGYGADRGYDRGGYGGDYYRDYGYGGYDSRAGGYAGYGGYGGGYDSRGGYDRSGYSGGYDDARGYGSYGPERGGSRGYGAPRSGPYDRR